MSFIPLTGDETFVALFAVENLDEPDFRTFFGSDNIEDYATPISPFIH
jgi:hypothetical protein